MVSEELCRLCLTVHASNIAIFSVDGKGLDISGILSKHFQLEIKGNDGESQYICNNCWSITIKFNQLFCKVKRIFSRNSPTTDDIEADASSKVEMLPDYAMLFKGGAEMFVEDYQANIEELNSETNDTSNAGTDASNDEESEIRPERLKKGSELIERPVRARKSENYTAITQCDENKPGCVDKRIVNVRNAKDGEKSKVLQRYDEDSLIREYFAMVCELCDFKFRTLLEARLHYRTEHRKAGYLTCCNKRFFYRGGLMDHISVHLNPQAFKCAICHKSYGNKFALADHMQLKHMSLDERQHTCEKCDRKFSKRYRLRQHMSLSHTDNTETKVRLICDICGKSFGNKASILTHMRYYHMQNYSKICDVCAKTFNCEKTFQSHCLTHTNQPRMQCTICDKWLKSKDSLRSHLRRHNDTQHTCKHCNKMTPNRQALANHILYVHSEKKHKCTLCSKAFKVALGLKEHMASHTGQSLYTCPYCPRTFNSNGNMHKHRKNVHSEEWRRDREERLRKLTIPNENG